MAPRAVLQALGSGGHPSFFPPPLKDAEVGPFLCLGSVRSCHFLLVCLVSTLNLHLGVCILLL